MTLRDACCDRAEGVVLAYESGPIAPSGLDRAELSARLTASDGD